MTKQEKVAIARREMQKTSMCIRQKHKKHCTAWGRRGWSIALDALSDFGVGQLPTYLATNLKMSHRDLDASR